MEHTEVKSFFLALLQLKGDASGLYNYTSSFSFGPLLPPPLPTRNLQESVLLAKKEVFTKREPSEKLEFSTPNVFSPRLQLVT